jgi:glyoxylase I family protein
MAITFALGGCMTQQAASSLPTSNTPASPDADMVSVRYLSPDIERAIAFYTQVLDFHLDQRTGSMFAAVSRKKLRLILSGPGSSGARPMLDGRKQTPGGWNRILLYVDDLASTIEKLRAAGVRFRNEVESGPGGSQIQIEDPDGNPIELHEAPRK